MIVHVGRKELIHLLPQVYIGFRRWCLFPLPWHVPRWSCWGIVGILYTLLWL